jgi:hypothetical protein
MIAHNPLHGSGPAALPHPALALGNDAHAAQRIGLTDRRQWQPAGDVTWGPMWVATSHSCDFFIHYNLAGLTGAQEKCHAKNQF